jgi:hypothetical protein
MSDVYRIPTLRTECERVLSSHINVDSVLTLMQVGVTAHATELESACLRFVVEHAAIVRRHASYEECTSMDVLRRVAAAWANELEYDRDRSHL